MKRRWLRLLGRILLLGPLVLLLGLGVWSSWQQREIEKREAIYLWLENTVIPEIDWKDQTLAQCVQWLNQRIRATPGHPRGLHIAIATPEETARRFRRQVLPAVGPISIPGLEDTPPAPQPPPPEKITLPLTGMPFAEILRYVQAIFNLERETDARRIFFHRTRGEPGTVEPLVAKTLRWDPAVFQQYHYRRTLSGEEMAEPGKDLRPFLAEQGVQFFEGCSAEFDPKTGVLHLRSTQLNIEIVEMTMPYGRKYSWREQAQRQWEWGRWQLEQWLWPPPPITFPPIPPRQP